MGRYAPAGEGFLPPRAHKWLTDLFIGYYNTYTIFILALTFLSSFIIEPGLRSFVLQSLLQPGSNDGATWIAMVFLCVAILATSRYTFSTIRGEKIDLWTEFAAYGTISLVSVCMAVDYLIYGGDTAGNAGRLVIFLTVYYLFSAGVIFQASVWDGSYIEERMSLVPQPDRQKVWIASLVVLLTTVGFILQLGETYSWAITATTSIAVWTILSHVLTRLYFW